MTVEKCVRRVDLILQIIIPLHQQLLREFVRVRGLLESFKEREWIKPEPDLSRIAIYFMNRAQEGGQRRRPRFFIVLFKESFERCSHKKIGLAADERR